MNTDFYKTKMLRLIMWALTLLWLALVFFLSSQTGDATKSLSLRVAVYLSRLFRISADDLPAFHLGLRTAAHVVVYFVLGMLVYSSISLSLPKARLSWLYVSIIGSFLAVLDEVRKAYIPGRHCSFAEAGLNCIGLLLGVLCVLLFKRLYHYYK